MHRILKVNMAVNVNLVINKLLAEEEILDRYCGVCEASHNASQEKRVAVSGRYLIVQLKRFRLNEGNWIKDLSLVRCADEQLSFSVDLDDEIQQ